MKHSLLYIDPGTGSLLVSLIGGAAMTIAFSLRKIIRQVYIAVGGRKYQSNSYLPGEIVFYSEGGKYWNVFKPVLKEFNQRHQSVFYFTSDKNDPGLNSDYESVKAIYVGKLNQAFHVLNNLNCKILVSTTPHLNIFGWKISNQVGHYSYLMHSPIDIHAYKFFAFDYYDSILCSSEQQIRDLRELEKLRSMKEKVLFNTGCTYYDESNTLLSEINEHVLIAPTWGNRSFLPSHGVRIIRALIDNNIKVRLRPHPQSWISDKSILSDISSEFGDTSMFEFDYEKNIIKSIQSSRAVVCDIYSGLVFDSTLCNRRPVIAFDFGWNSVGYEAYFLTNTTSSIQLLMEAGAIISEEDIESLGDRIKNLDFSKLNNINPKHFVSNFKNAGKIAANQIMEIGQNLI